MFSNHIKIAWRYLSKNKGFAIVNLFGLAIGISTCLVIYLITGYEFSFDHFHQHADRIYRIGGMVQENNERTFYVEDIPPAAAAAFRNQVTGIEAATGFYPYKAKVTIRNNDSTTDRFDGPTDGTNAHKIIITDPSYFTIFKYEWLVGDATTALQAPFTVVLSESMARTYFGAIPLHTIPGKEIIYDDSLRVTVSGIVKDWNRNTDFPFNQFISANTINSSFLQNSIDPNNWNHVRGLEWAWTFVKLSGNQTPANIKKQLDALVKQHMEEDPINKFSLVLQSLGDVHFNGDFSHDGIRKAHKPTLYVLMGIALFILLIAVVNFINLATAQAFQRTKEIAIRKVLGSGATRLMKQLLTETFVITVLAAGMALVMARLALPVFRDFIPAGVSFNLLQPATAGFIVFITIITTLLAGWYPAKILASQITALNLKSPQKGSQTWYIRKGLVLFQCTVSLIFIICSMVIGDQMKFMRYSDLVFKTEAVVTITNREDDKGKMPVLANAIQALPGVKEVVLQGNAPLFYEIEIPIGYKGKKEGELMVNILSGRENFIPFYNMTLMAGNNLRQSDSLHNLVINETCLRMLGFHNASEAIGQLLYIDKRSYPIAGVVADFHIGSFHERIGPVAIAHMPEKEKSIGIKLSTKGKAASQVQHTLAQIEHAWKATYPGVPFSYQFLDDAVAAMYKKEQKMATLVKTAVLITLFISCTGLFGLVLFMNERRTKEISIRKVMGAGSKDIVYLLSKDFFILIVIALLVASPVAWYFMRQWLQDFAYRVLISWWIFALAGLVTIGIAFVTVGYHTLKMVLANPVKSLRTE